MIRRYLSAALAVLVILVALVALVAQAVLECRTYDLDRSARVIDEALADPANRDALDRSRRAADSYRPPGGWVTKDPRGGAKLSEGFRDSKSPRCPSPLRCATSPSSCS